MKRQKNALLIGLPTIVNTLALLAFACAAMLSLSHANADLMTAEHSRDVSQDYFAADSRAQNLLGALAEQAALPVAEAGAEMEAVLNDQGIAARFEESERLLRFDLPAGEAGTLQVGIVLTDAGQYDIRLWQLVPHETPTRE